MRYGSVCSGIEAASMAWEPIGWRPAWFAEIEPFPSAVLAHHWPDVPNLGDFTLIRDRIAAGEVEAPDVLVGGTPCQAFSVAGLRASMDDKRGQLTLEFVRLADAIDSDRNVRGLPAAIVVWENVPGVLTTKDNAFGCFLGALAGEDVALEPPGGKWTNAGVVVGPTRTIAWRVLDAQYFGVAQRRRRVFVVASAGGLRPEQVLFEFDGVRRDSPPSRQQGQGASADAQGGTGAGSHWDGVPPHPSLTQSHNTGGIGQSNQELFSQQGSGLVPAPFTDCADTLTASMSRNWNGNAPAENGSLFVQDAIAIQGSLVGRSDKAGPSGPGYSDPGAPQYTLTKTDVHAVAFEPGIMGRCGSGHTYPELSGTLRKDHGDNQMAVAFDCKASGSYGFQESTDIVGQCATGDVFHTLRAEGFDASEDGTGRGVGAVAVGFSSKDYGSDASEDLVPTMRSMGHNESHANGGGQLAVDVALRGRDGGATAEVGDDAAFTIRASTGGGDKPHALIGMQVRRLTPTECERLQGFPDGHTRIPWRNKPAEECPDGPRYKALGNSMCVAVMQWIGERIAKKLEEV